ncbi:MAG: transporter substrate-binding domain-containing protein, partial [Nocardia sp.]|nr:transporter substrate-binding domain-containing protein [Nocardia sp.]
MPGLPAPRPRALLAALLLAVALLATACGGGGDGDSATRDLCAPPGPEAASAAPANLSAPGAGKEDRFTTASTEPPTAVDTARLGLIRPGVLSVGTLSDAPPSICVNSAGAFTGFDNELLRAVAAKIGLRVEFSGTEFAGLLAQVAGKRFDVGSSNITTTDARREMVGFTNG